MRKKFSSLGQLRPFICKTCLLLTLAAIALSCQKQMDSTLVNSESAISDNISATAYHIEASLPAGYVKNGTVDYTKYIQAAVNKYDNIIFPGFPIQVSDIGIQLRSNTKLSFDKGSKLILKASKKENYDVLSIRNCDNVKIYSAVIVGDRNIHNGSGGEWGMGIGIYSSSNIQVFYPLISNTWGDGIYIGSTDKNVASVNISIEKANVTNARRNGITIANAKGVKIANCYLAKSNGTIPQDGICIEPNSYRDEITGIVLTNNQTYMNKGYGVEFSMSKMYGGSDKKIDAVVTNHVDKGSLSAAYVSCYHEKSSHGEKITGSIVFDKPQWYNFGQYVWRPYGLQEPGLFLKLVNPSLYDKNNNLIDKSTTVSLLKREIYSSANCTIVNN